MDGAWNFVKIVEQNCVNLSHQFVDDVYEHLVIKGMDPTVWTYLQLHQYLIIFILILTTLTILSRMSVGDSKKLERNKFHIQVAVKVMLEWSKTWYDISIQTTINYGLLFLTLFHAKWYRAILVPNLSVGLKHMSRYTLRKMVNDLRGCWKFL